MILHSPIHIGQELLNRLLTKCTSPAKHFVIIDSEVEIERLNTLLSIIMKQTI